MDKLCARQYKLESSKWMSSGICVFTVSYVGEIIHGKRGRVWELSGDERVKVTEILTHKTVAQFREEKISSADKKLRAAGNLQEVYSTSTLRRVRCEGLALQDLDKDDIRDLENRHKKQVEKVNNNDVGAELFIQEVNSVPFFVIAISDKQIEILLKMLADNDLINLYADATGSVVAAPQGITKRIYYYAGVLALRVLDETQALLLPLLEMVSASHNAYTISCWFRFLRYMLSMVTTKWPVFNHLVTDFSYAILNAAADAMNRESLIEHINNTYTRVASGESLENALTVFLHICCNHFSKTMAKDIDKAFPKESSSQKVQKVLKEIIAAMFNLSDLKVLATVYQHLYVLLTSKFVNVTVPSSLQELSVLISTEGSDTGHEDEIDEQQEEILTYDETITYESLYESSLFYQHFKRLNDFASGNTQNQFYSPSFAQLFLKKYVAILPLWTAINNGNRVDNCKPDVRRFSNSYAENYFKYLKKSLILAEPKLGCAPLKCGRFLTHTRSRINAVAEEYLHSFPKTHCCRSPQTNRKPRTNFSNHRRTSVTSDVKSTEPSTLELNISFPATTRKRSLFSTPSSLRNVPVYQTLVIRRIE